MTPSASSNASPSALRRFFSALFSWLRVPGEREALEAHLNASTDVHDLEARQRAWDQRHRSTFFN